MTEALKMNYWTDKWDLHVDICPCDVHFNDWIETENICDKVIYHFGTGTHHVIGAAQAENGRGNTVFSITASIGEYEAYIKLVAEKSGISKHYLAYFGDIYLSNPVLLPEFDIVTMFHLCEFLFPNTTSDEYGGLDDLGVLNLFTDRTRKGGHILFYTKSMAFEKARPVIYAWEKEKRVERVGEFKTLLIYRKVA
ncbi:MAG: hypothetical protein AB7O50_10510 [Pseudolabrys sp.]